MGLFLRVVLIRCLEHLSSLQPQSGERVFASSTAEPDIRLHVSTRFGQHHAHGVPHSDFSQS